MAKPGVIKNTDAVHNSTNTVLAKLIESILIFLILYAETNKYEHKRNADVNVGTAKEAVILYSEACRKTVIIIPNIVCIKLFYKNTT
ncbi:hypothetical protein ACRTC3_11500 [Photobacterium damselae]|uniref:hypothetical protein n=1 Tax=Photobacterium damselae TaxID=38293 RepID=UPI003D7E1894